MALYSGSLSRLRFFCLSVRPKTVRVSAHKPLHARPGSTPPLTPSSPLLLGRREARLNGGGRAGVQPRLRRALRHDVLDAPLGALLPLARLVACSHPRGVKRRCSRLPLASKRVAVVIDKEDVRLHRVEVCAYNDTRPRTRPERDLFRPVAPQRSPGGPGRAPCPWRQTRATPTGSRQPRRDRVIRRVGTVSNSHYLNGDS